MGPLLSAPQIAVKVLGKPGILSRLENLLETHVVVGIQFFADVELMEAVSSRPALLF